MSRGVLLGQQRKPERALQILVPRGYEDGDVRIVGHCHVCGLEFGEGEEQAWQKHVGDCARAHMSEIHESLPSVRQKGGPFDPDSWDREADEYLINVVGERMKREGRFEIRPNERVS